MVEGMGVCVYYMILCGKILYPATDSECFIVDKKIIGMHTLKCIYLPGGWLPAMKAQRE